MSDIGIVKKVLSAGTPGLPSFEKDTRVLFHYQVLAPKVDTSKEGFPADPDQFEIIDDTRKQWPKGYGEPLELVIGRKFQLPVFENCIKCMHKNEIAQFDIEMKQMQPFPMVSKKLRDIAKAKLDPKSEEQPHQHHCAGMGIPKTGYEELDKLMEDPKDLRVIIHLIKVEQPSDYKADNWQLDNNSKLKKIEDLKCKANEFVKAKKFELAIDDYRQGLTLLDQLILLEKPGEPEWKELDDKTVPFYSNLAYCYLSLQRYRETDNASSEALKRDASNEKALFRRARAKTALYEFDEAEEDLNALLSVNAANKSLVEEEKRRLKKAREDKAANENDLFKKMVAK